MGEEWSCPWASSSIKPPALYFGHLVLRADSSEKILMLGKIEGKRRRRQQRMRWLDSITNSMDMNLSKFRVLSSRGSS